MRTCTTYVRCRLPTQRFRDFPPAEAYAVEIDSLSRFYLATVIYFHIYTLLIGLLIRFQRSYDHGPPHEADWRPADFRFVFSLVLSCGFVDQTAFVFAFLACRYPPRRDPYQPARRDHDWRWYHQINKTKCHTFTSMCSASFCSRLLVARIAMYIYIYGLNKEFTYLSKGGSFYLPTYIIYAYVCVSSFQIFVCLFYDLLCTLLSHSACSNAM